LNDAHRAVHRSTQSTASNRTFEKHAVETAKKTVVLNACLPVSFPVEPVQQMLGPVESCEGQVALRPSIFIGVGGLAARVLGQLRYRLCERFGNVDDVPAFQMLCLDTDGRMLSEAARGDATTALRGHQLVPMPLRSPGDYRNDSQALLEWLNRRWLYNIPRSLLTEGIRALGRLAFVDHYGTVSEALRQTLNNAIASDAIEESVRKTGVEFDQQDPRVFVIGSSSGGTSGGCILDLGYAVRSVLHDMHCSDSQLYGVLAHATPRNAKGRDLAIANTVCLLDEYRRFTSSEGYPGEPACGLMQQPGSTPPFEHTYFLSCDEDSGLDAVPIEGRLAEYIYQATAGKAAGILQQTRDATGDDSLASTSLRTFGCSRICGTQREFIEREADAICRRLISHWAGNMSPISNDSEHTIDPGIAELTDKFAEGLDLQIDRLLGWANDIVASEIAEDVHHFFRRTISDIRVQLGDAPGATASESSAEQICEQIDSLLFPAGDAALGLHAQVKAKVRDTASTKAEALRDWFLMLVGARKTRVQGAHEAVHWFSDYLNDVEQKLQSSLIASEMDPDLNVTSDDDDRLLRYGLARVRQLVMRLAGEVIRRLRAETIHSSDRLYELSTRLRQLKIEFSKPEGSVDALMPELVELSEQLAPRQRELTSQLDQQLAPALANKEIALSALLKAGSDVWLRLVSTMRSTATTLVAGVVTRLQVAALVCPDDSRETSPSPKRCVNGTIPELLGCGGTARLLIVAPRAANDWPTDWCQPFATAAGIEPKVILDSDQALTMCCEASDVPLANVIAKLVGPQTDFYKLASRLHTRIDVDWSSLDDWINGKGE